VAAGEGQDSGLYELNVRNPQWFRRSAGGGPGPAMGATLTVDPEQQVLVLAGGLALAQDGPPGSTSVWLFDLRARRWSEVPGVLPSTRRSHTAIFDPRARVHVLVGGETAQERGNFAARGRPLRDVVLIRVRPKS
jgi:hypothetical protein